MTEGTGDQTLRLGIDLGGTKTEIVVIDRQFKIHHRHRVLTPTPQGYQAILNNIGEMVFAADAMFQYQLPVGLGTPGSISPFNGLLRNSSTACLNGKAIQKDIENLLHRPVKIQNDANCFVLSEALNGAGKNAAIVFGVIIGTGSGAALVINGQLLEGKNRIAGEWGHNPLPWMDGSDYQQQCYCGKINCIETFLSGTGLAKRFQQRFAGNLSTKQIVEAARAGDVNCIEAMDHYYDQLARALAQIINIVDPDIIVLGGGMSNIDEIYHELPNRLLTYVFSEALDTPVVAAQHGDSSGVIGAALLSE